MSNNVGCARGFPPSVEVKDETGIEGRVLGAENLGILGIDITWEVVGLVFDLGCVVLLFDL